MNYLLYGHGGSKNHGCEAIVRSTKILLDDCDLFLASRRPKEDKTYGVDQLMNVYSEKNLQKKPTKEFIKSYLELKIHNNFLAMDKLAYKQAIPKNIQFDAALSIGGDNYCYDNIESYITMNKLYHEEGIKTVLWGCSVEPKLLEREDVCRDIASYSLITARESISYNALFRVNPRTVLVSDPAFILQPQKCELPEGFEIGNTVGINLSPMVIGNEKKKGIVFENYRELIRFVLESTNYHIALIPHVVWNREDDRIPLNKLYKEFPDSNRIHLVEDGNCMELKYCISCCRFFIGARTHTTIAAYSSSIPALAVGYSVKAKGIARDIFGTDNGYVIPVQNFEQSTDLKTAFIWLMDNEDKILKLYKNSMATYCEKAYIGMKELQDLLE